MIGLSRWLFRLTIVLALLTLAKDYPPYRIYLLDLVFIPFLFGAFVLKLSMPRRLKFEWQLVDKLMLAMLAFIVLAFVFSESVRQSAVTFFDWVRVVALYFVARMMFVQSFTEDSLRRVYTFCAGLLIVIGLIQLVTNSSFGLIGNYFGSGNEQGVAATVAGVGSRSRISGTTSNPIIFAMWVTLFALVVAAHFNVRRKTLLFVGISGIASVVVLATLSRGAIAAFALSWIIFVFLNRAELMRNAIAGVVIVVFLVPMVFLGLQDSVLGEAAEMLQARVEQQELLEEDSGRVRVFKMGLELVSQPKIFLVGTGPDNMVLAYNKFASGIKSSNYANEGYQRSGVHNIWMKMFVEYGAAAALLFIAIWYQFLRHALRLWKARKADRSAKMWGGFAVSFLIPFLLIDSMVYESAMSYHVLMPLFVVMAFVVARTQREGKAREPHPAVVRAAQLRRERQAAREQ